MVHNENEEVVQWHSFEIKLPSKQWPALSHERFIYKQILTTAM
jgi:hypothetical protein